MRWWNIAVAGLLLLGFSSIVAPIAFPETRDGLWGNVLAETWGILAASAIAWVVFKRFQVERFDRATFTLFDSVRGLRRLALEIYPEIVHLNAPSLDALSAERKQRLRELAELTFLRSSLFSRYLEIEDLSALDSCATSAYELSVKHFSEASEENMCALFSQISRIYLCSSLVLESGVSDQVVGELSRARAKWSDRWKQTIAAK